jgi:hypothetical protein
VKAVSRKGCEAGEGKSFTPYAAFVFSGRHFDFVGLRIRAIRVICGHNL